MPLGIPVPRVTTPGGIGLPPGADTPTSGDPNTTDVGGFGGLFASILDLIHGIQGQGTERGAVGAAMADPFAAQRPQYQQQLLGLLSDPSSFKMDPGAVFARDEGLQGVARAGNSMFGTTRSGNTAVELERYATGFGEQAYNKRIDQLMAMAGVNTGSPAAAADAYLRGTAENDKDLGSGLHSIDTILNMLSKSGVGGAALDAIKKALGMTGGGGLGGNFTTQPDAPGGGGINGTGDEPPGLGGDAPGSTGPQYDWGTDPLPGFDDGGGLGLFDGIAGP